MGIILLAALIIGELTFAALSIITKNLCLQEKNVVHISEFALLVVLLFSGIFEWSFRYYGIALVLLIQAVIAGIGLWRGKDKPYKLSKVIRNLVTIILLYIAVLTISIVCPQYKQPVKTGSYPVASAKYTWTDNSRVETYSNSGDKRKLTVEFWYPENVAGKCPLVVFSHGAFGFSGSNISTFEELASNGYIVASIGHTYQAFFTLDTSGKLTTVDTNFLNSAMELQNNDNVSNEFEISHSWLKIRTADENFVLDTIIDQAKSNSSGKLFSKVDTDSIGLFGHSLGGASSAEVGRQRDGIKAVIVLDGTMIGEEVREENGRNILNNTPYPVPLLNIYAADHYTNAQKTDGSNYANFYAASHALNAQEIIIKGAGHLNFTDLPLFSPTLAKMLGVGTVDSRYCIETTNNIILKYFNCYLKGKESPHFEKEY